MSSVRELYLNQLLLNPSFSQPFASQVVTLFSHCLTFKILIMEAFTKSTKVMSDKCTLRVKSGSTHWADSSNITLLHRFSNCATCTTGGV